MGENLGIGCTLLCNFKHTNAALKPSREEMVRWLTVESGLSKEYVDKIVRMQCENGLKITFDTTANCLIALRQIKNRALYGRYGWFDASVRCPRCVFKAVHLIPEKNSVELLSRDAVIESLKEYGEIIEIREVKWHDGVVDDYIPNGDVKVRILLTKITPNVLKMNGITTIVENLVYEFDYSDEILQDLWENRLIQKTVDYNKKLFQMKDHDIGCTIDITFQKTGNYVPSKANVYNWLVRSSGLSEEHRRKILAFSFFDDGNYQIVFEDGVNCLNAIQEMKNCFIPHSYGVLTKADIKCPKGEFVDLILLSDSADKLLTREILEQALEPYGIIVEYRRSNGSSQCDPSMLSFDIHCKIFKTSQMPHQLRICGYRMEVIICEPRCQNCDIDTLNDLWIRLS